jgi:RNA polymerase sigma-70 factor (ECF subfamily)
MEIAKQSQSDHKPNFNELFYRYNAHVRAIALKICGNTAAAEDAVQDAWIAAYTNIHQLRSSDAFLPWLKRIVMNSCYQMLRSDRRLMLTESIPVSDKLIQDSIESKFEQVAERDKLYTVLSSLPLHMRQTVMLRYLSGYTSYVEIAAITGVPVGTVRSRLNDSKKKLANLLNQPFDPGSNEFKSSLYWNQFYEEVLPACYRHPNLLSDFFNHIGDDLNIVFTSGKTVIGKSIFEESVFDDMEHGSRLSTVESCITSGDLTLLKVSFENSPEHPSHCPPNSYLTFLREKGKMTRMRLYHSARGIVSDFS